MWLRDKNDGTVYTGSKQELIDIIGTNYDDYRVNNGDYKNGEGIMIVVAGMIGVGKSSATKLLADRYNATAFYEPVKGNDVLQMFYSNKEKYGFLLQMDFLHRRFQMIKEAGRLDNKGQITILDRSIWEDLYFTQKNNEIGNIADIELQVYKRGLENMMEEIDSLPKKNADVLIYFTAPFERILSNIAKRDRKFEQSEADIEYFKLLWEGYDKWFENYNYGPKIKIDLTHWDLSKPDEAEIVLQKIDSELKRIKGE